MVVRRARDGASAFQAAAADWRRDDEPAAHGGQDCAGVQRTRRPCARRVASRGRGLEPARLRSAPEFDRSNREAQAETREKYAARTTKPLLTYDQALANRLRLDWDDASRLRPRGSSAAATWTTCRWPMIAQLHRLDVLLLGVGAERPLSGDPVAPAVRHPGAGPVRRCAGAAGADHR